MAPGLPLIPLVGGLARSANPCPACPGLAGGYLAHGAGSPWGERGVLAPGPRPHWAPESRARGRAEWLAPGSATVLRAGRAWWWQGRPDVVPSRSRPPRAHRARDMISRAPAAAPASMRVESCAGVSARPLRPGDRAHGGGLARSPHPLPIAYLQTLTCPWPLPPRAPHSLAPEPGDHSPCPCRNVGRGGLADRLP